MRAGVDRRRARRGGASTARPSGRRGARCRRRDRCCRPAGTTAAPAAAHAGSDGGDLGGVARPDDERRLAAEAARPVGGVRGGDVGVGEDVVGADDVGQRAGQSGSSRHRVTRPGRSSSVCRARPTGPSSSNSRASARPTPVGCHVRHRPAAHPLADRVAVQGDDEVGVDELHLVGLGVAAERVAAVGERAIRWNGDGSSSGSSGTVRIHTVVAPGPLSSPGG